MKLDVSSSNLILLVSAVNDAIKYNEGFLHSETIKDVSDYEEHLLCLENLQNWLEDQYKDLEKDNPDLMNYTDVIKNT
ncbi:MAG TPA: hypothetical protein ENI64_04530 [Gammaproteobacteria bacterium]|nr:hypothetical protein [Gammaproteobacteria bacterium]